MKITTLVACLLFATHFMYCQKTLPASGGESSGSGGTVSYSVGQLVYTTNAGSNGSASQGIQQSIELYTLSNPELTALTLTTIAYPNPTTDHIVLALKNSELLDLSYAIYDIHGRVVTKGMLQHEDTLISMNNMAAGVYILKVNKNNTELKTFKIIKK